ncbi:xylulose kinase [Rhodococcus sp. 15-725-2-2b]|uniref:xylulokinase n=1 Tax=unclassified Rhodococcus (in: high G+C Gram-positive bacteria) TaxID=192944 RepID=UPI000B9AE9E5|nr:MULTISPECIES: FGGY family carbohydrate kinase [unclassified Rhodococcus (in: high G+C Gram-positive bacteria)]OZC67521.1 xylulose kinase [Rhodococcus sp. 06-470-2]OZC70072.1 xylulose kinase [Rhodococcus sp. 06-469-3-2]OZD40249.1 xylulose kinase [Rhodococcus sp. 06-1477-1A]OZE63169.1 xylulose kinase [Rhodococcus sp. 05-2221-1B]OZE75398.1 xylulose kinase [Rhodococcus sp. 15-725-2-2b]
MALVAGIDSSTQSCKVFVRDAESGELVRQGRASHPDGTEIDPQRWKDALDEAVAAAGGLDDVDAVSVGAQQHGMVCLDETGTVVRNALLWNDTRSAQAATDLVSELGKETGVDGGQAWADAVGVVPLASITVAKLRWLADHEPENADRTAAVCLPHDWLSWQLGGASGLDSLATDRGDASGTGYFSAASNEYRTDLLQLGFRGRNPQLPRVAAPNETIGRLRSGALIGPGTGDNAAAALALDAQPGDVVVSVGTSGVVSAVTSIAAADGSGLVAGFADATGRQLPLVCTLNAARVLDATARLLGVDHDELSRLALSTTSDGLVLVPYLEGERTPNRPDASGAIHGLRLNNSTPGHLARAAIEGLLCGLADGIDHLRAQGVETKRVLLIGGGAKSAALRALAPAILGVPVTVPEPGEYVADGAARQAAWTLAGTTEPPTWAQAPSQTYEADPTPAVRERYAEVRDLTEGTTPM